MRDPFINAIKETLEDNNNITLVAQLAQILPLGKEAIYRRLSGRVQFTFDEVLEISKALNISLDKIYQDTDLNKASFNLNLINADQQADNYHDILVGYVRIFEKIKTSPTTRLRSAYNIMPYSFFLNQDLLSKFHLYKWLYMVNSIDRNITLSDYKTPKKISQVQRRFRDECQFIRSASFVLSRDIFKNFAEDIALFVELDLINPHEKNKLKLELLDILKTIEITASTGFYKTGSEVSIYLANINLDASYTLFEGEDIEMTHFRIFSINGIESRNPRICKQSKIWIDALQNYSTSITRSDSMHRALYFDEQRSLILKILK